MSRRCSRDAFRATGYAAAGHTRRGHTWLGQVEHDAAIEAGAFAYLSLDPAVPVPRDLARLFGEAFVVLRRGGSVCIKDVFRCAGALGGAERLELAEFDLATWSSSPNAPLNGGYNSTSDFDTPNGLAHFLVATTNGMELVVTTAAEVVESVAREARAVLRERLPRD
jgi:hypothetical protein